MGIFSKTREKVIGLIFSHPDTPFYLNDIIRRCDIGRGAVQRELAALEEEGLLIRRQEGHLVYFIPNKASPIFNELHSIAIKTFGLVDILSASLQPYASQITRAFIYGSVAKSTMHAQSDIDLLVVSDTLAYSELITLLDNPRDILQRDIHFTLYTSQEWEDKLSNHNHFLTSILAGPIISIIGSHDVGKTVKKPCKNRNHQT